MSDMSDGVGITGVGTRDNMRTYISRSPHPETTPDAEKDSILELGSRQKGQETSCWIQDISRASSIYTLRDHEICGKILSFAQDMALVLVTDKQGWYTSGYVNPA